jgi:hypothetical protein
MAEASAQGWTTRAQERQINTLYYERLLATSDRPAVEQEAIGAIAPLQTPRDFVRDPVMLEFLGLPGVGRLLEATSNEVCWTIFRHSYWSLDVASLLLEGSIGSALNLKTSMSIWSSTTSS